MKKFLYAIAFTLLSIGGVYAQADYVVPAGQSQPTDPELKNLQWNHYKADPFVIMSIDNEQGKWLSTNLTKIKSWCITRWGFPDFEFSKQCKVMCVPNRVLMKKLFNLTESYCEVRRKDGKIEMTVLWLILDDKPAKTIPIQLSMVCFAEFEAKHNVKFGWYAQRGMSLLNSTVADVRGQLGSLGNDLSKGTPLFTTEKILTMTEDDYNKQSPEGQRIFDQQSVAMCLILRKEFGEAKMQGFFRLCARNKTDDVLRLIYGFRDYQHFDSSFSRYMKDLSGDVLSSKTPDSYLEITPVK